MQTFLVGGAVRDQLIGLSVDERDWVVVGASPEVMIEHGFKPVGKDFPVFLHPQTQEAYALARTERKTGKGYHGFVFYTGTDVTLEQDLRRRDLTVNAMALDKKGQLIDPFGGLNDLHNKILRHVSPAFNEDPVRILRIARFMARFEPLGFRVAENTLALMQDMSAGGEISALTAERVWKEFVKTLTAPAPAAFFHTLQKVNALEVLAPELAELFNGLQSYETLAEALSTASSKGNALAGFTVLASWAAAADLQLYDWCIGLKAPKAYQQLARMMPQLYTLTKNRTALNADTLLHFFKRNDLLRNPQRLNRMGAVWSLCALPQYFAAYSSTVAYELLGAALQTVIRTDLGAVLSQCNSPNEIKAAVVQEQLRALHDFLARLSK